MSSSKESVTFQRVSFGPIELLSEAKALMGEQYLLFVGICFVGILIGSLVPLGIIMGAMICGIMLCFFARMRGEEAKFDTLFKGFDYFVESLIAMLIIVGIMCVVLVPLYLVFIVGMIGLMVAEGGPDEAARFGLMFPMFGLIYAVVLVVSLLLGTFFIFVFPLIVDRDLKAWDAIKTSCSAALANFGSVIALLLVSSLLAMAASLCCYFPVFFVLPLQLGAVAIAYRRVFP